MYVCVLKKRAVGIALAFRLLRDPLPVEHARPLFMSLHLYSVNDAEQNVKLWSRLSYFLFTRARLFPYTHIVQLAWMRPGPSQTAFALGTSWLELHKALAYTKKQQQQKIKTRKNINIEQERETANIRLEIYGGDKDTACTKFSSAIFDTCTAVHMPVAWWLTWSGSCFKQTMP